MCGGGGEEDRSVGVPPILCSRQIDRCPRIESEKGSASMTQKQQQHSMRGTRRLLLVDAVGAVRHLRDVDAGLKREEALDRRRRLARHRVEVRDLDALRLRVHDLVLGHELHHDEADDGQRPADAAAHALAHAPRAESLRLDDLAVLERALLRLLLGGGGGDGLAVLAHRRELARHVLLPVEEARGVELARVRVVLRVLAHGAVVDHDGDVVGAVRAVGEHRRRRQPPLVHVEEREVAARLVDEGGVHLGVLPVLERQLLLGVDLGHDFLRLGVDLLLPLREFGEVLQDVLHELRRGVHHADDVLEVAHRHALEAVDDGAHGARVLR
mmetsp:Transcript_25875/g.79894  ORF Transcript_25875/g.79894 Transcript_25875/m.79894 type:complete len:327 (-) Transcript_25875:956-1936(-)